MVAPCHQKHTSLHPQQAAACTQPRSAQCGCTVSPTPLPLPVPERARPPGWVTHARGCQQRYLAYYLQPSLQHAPHNMSHMLPLYVPSTQSWSTPGMAPTICVPSPMLHQKEGCLAQPAHCTLLLLQTVQEARCSRAPVPLHASMHACRHNAVSPCCCSSPCSAHC
jgi:hypothetical protein